MPDPRPSDSTDPLDLARRVLETEAAAILGLIPQLDGSFVRAVDLLHECAGRVVATGLGKSGIIARKIAATLSSTGTPAMFLHPVEAIHGDLGMLQADDVVIALSQSGETEEIVRLVVAIRRIGARLISFTGNAQSKLSQVSDVTLSCRVNGEAGPIDLAPTASTTAALALGDALALALSQRKNFRSDQFRGLHPGGSLGKKGMCIDALMHTGERIPKVRPDTPMPDVIHEMSDKRLGMTCVVDADGRLEGIVTDGDLRRHMNQHSNLLGQRAGAVMTARPVTIGPHALGLEALHLMEARKITSLVVVDASAVVVGVVHLHDLW